MDLEQPVEPFISPPLGGRYTYIGRAPHHVSQIQEVWETGTTLAPWEPTL